MNVYTSSQLLRTEDGFDGDISYALKHVDCPSLKPEQWDSIEAVYDGKDVFVWLPTGYGMSICYTTLPFALDYKLGRIDSGNHSVVSIVGNTATP